MHVVHRLGAVLVGLFVSAHLINHLVAVLGVEMHMAVMDTLRLVYRHPVVEGVLLGCVVLQVGSGLYFIKLRWGQRRGFWGRLQSIAGGYLAFFLLLHVSAVLAGRFFLELDTNFFFAAAGMHTPPFHLFFLPYYSLAILAFFSHIACALHWFMQERFRRKTRNRVGFAVLLLGALVCAVIITALNGGFYHVQIPDAYQLLYQR